LFDPVDAYVPRSVEEIESAYAASDEGIASRAAAQESIANAYAFVATLNAREVTETSQTWQDDASYRDPLSD
jgi:hypothetical protein